MISDKKIANALSGKTARACDCCIRKRARWYCPADDAFLCQSCDASVHYANSLARRHDRVRLKTASLNPSNDLESPSWHRGLTRKPRTPRGHPKNHSKSEDRNLMNIIVPELSMEDTTSPQEFETEEQLLYRVPIFDPFVTEFQRSPTRSFEVERGPDEVGQKIFDDLNSSQHQTDEYLPSDLEEFAADVESLLGKGLDCESFGIEELGILDCSPEIVNDNNNNNNTDCSDKFVKEEELYNDGMIVIKDPFQLSFDFDEDGDYKEIVMVEQSLVVDEMGKLKRDDDEKENNKEVVMKKRKRLLSLDYEAISEAWASHGSPWINGQRPEINPEDCWPLCMGTCGSEVRHPFFGENQIGGNGDGGREARVSRYREKRRTRLFSKKIRYEVRKLNAEKRPRMKGRFVKKSSLVDTATTFPLFPKM